MSDRKKQLKMVIEHLEAHGYQVSMAQSGHYRVVDETGVFVMNMPVTPSDHRSLLNLKSQLRRNGVPPFPPTVHKPKDKR